MISQAPCYGILASQAQIRLFSMETLYFDVSLRRNEAHKEVSTATDSACVLCTRSGIQIRVGTGEFCRETPSILFFSYLAQRMPTPYPRLVLMLFQNSEEPTRRAIVSYEHAGCSAQIMGMIQGASVSSR